MLPAGSYLLNTSALSAFIDPGLKTQMQFCDIFAPPHGKTNNVVFEQA